MRDLWLLHIQSRQDGKFVRAEHLKSIAQIIDAVLIVPTSYTDMDFIYG